jgi:phage protein D
VPVAPSADDILVLVAGGDGKHSAALPSFGATVSVTRAIRTA